MRRFLAVVALSSLAVALSAVACSNQGEGGQCNTNDDNNGDDDCSSGLVCDLATGLSNGVYATYGNNVQGFGYCCPTDRTQATTPQCALAAKVPGGNPAPPDGGLDAASDAPASTDAPSDAPTSVDAPADAPADAPLDSPADSPPDAPLDSPAD